MFFLSWERSGTQGWRKAAPRSSAGACNKSAMRGTPWIRFTLMALALGLAGIPIWLITRTDEPSMPSVAPAIQPQPAERELTLAIETAPPAQVVGARYLGRELVPPTQTNGSFSGIIRLPAGSASDLLVSAKWTETQTAALRVRASDENGPLADGSFWGREQIQEVLTVPEARR